MRRLAASALLACAAGPVASALLACAAGLVGCTPVLQAIRAPLVRPGDVPNPLLWRADHPQHGTLYLLGSVHLHKERIGDLGPAVDSAWEGSEELVVEIDTSNLSPADLAAVMERYSVLRPPHTLEDVFPAALWQRVSAHLRTRGIAEERVAHWKPWFLYLILVQIELARAGYQPEHGVDEVFIRAADGVKPIVALESMDAQLQIFDQLPVPLQLQLVEDALGQADEVPREVAALIDAWQRGDEGRLGALVFRPLEERPELEVFYDRLFFQRNRTMTAGLAQLARDGKTRFVVVGAGHMLGVDGIPALLEERGWSVALVGGLAR